MKTNQTRNRAQKLTRRTTHGLLLCAISALTLSGGAALAQAYPAKPIRFIVPYPPAGGADIVARLLATRLSTSLGQQVIVDNKPGASSMIGTDMLAKASPDGYTIGMVTDSHAINPTFFPKIPYDSVKDFESVSQLIAMPVVVVAHPSLNVKTIAELVAAAKAKPGRINYASTGNGSPHQIGMEWLKSRASVSMTHIPYKGVAPAMADIVGGQVDVMMGSISTALPYVKTGRLNALATTGLVRDPSLPTTPTVAESGYPGFDFKNWFGLMMPANTPRDIVMRMNKEVVAALNSPELREKLASLGMTASPSTPEEFSAFIRQESVKLNRIVKAADIKAE
ncbi:MAG: tripartite tricarboxylate transporter substrate binding protein [Pseudomonadota bacterium]